MVEYYGVDLGGTQLRIAHVNPTSGQIFNIDSYDASKLTSNNQILELILSRIEKRAAVGISAAGIVNEEKLTIENAPNSRIQGSITLGADLKKRGFKVIKVNDMKAAHNGIHIFGEGREVSDPKKLVVSTYSSGYNASNGQFDSEFGHIIYKPDGDLFCGCKGKGHYEIYLSGRGAEMRAQQFFMATRNHTHPIITNLARKNNIDLEEIAENPKMFEEIVQQIKSKDIYEACRRWPKENPQKEIREDQIKAIANSFGLINSVYNPDIIACMGGQTKDADVLFNPAINAYYSERFYSQISGLKKPKVLITTLKEPGIVGAVALVRDIV